MLRISKKGDYAVFLMGYLARHGSFGGPHVVSAQEIADRSHLHKSVVANLLKNLTKAGLLLSVRGMHGGYQLALPAAKISLGRILEVVEGPFALVDCASDAPDGDSMCSLLSFCPSKRPMRVLHGRIATLMDELKLDDLVGSDSTFAPQPPVASAAATTSSSSKPF